MIAAFLHAKQDPKYAAMMVDSVKKHMDCGIVQLTDEGTAPITGCTAVRLPWDGKNPMTFKMQHLAELRGDVLVLDTDVIVKTDLSPVFYLPFDIALTWREGPIFDTSGKDIQPSMPWNCGVMFSRKPQFWADCLEWCAGQPDSWYADQLAVKVIRKNYHTLRLHCDNFNYTPKSSAEDVSNRYAVHYKGHRKAWMAP